jgi:hypothetical protein
VSGSLSVIMATLSPFSALSAQQELRTTCILSAEEDDVNTGGNGADRIDCGKGHDSVRDFQPGQDKIKSYKPTIDRGSLLVKNR